jgi:hypothetical protein
MGDDWKVETDCHGRRLTDPGLLIQSDLFSFITSKELVFSKQSERQGQRI